MVFLFCSRGWQTRAHGSNPALHRTNLPTSLVQHIVYGWFLATMTEVNSYDTLEAHKAENVY